MSKYKTHAVLALERGYYVNAAGIPHSTRGPRKCHKTTTGFLRFSIHINRDGERVRSHVLVHQLIAYQLFGPQAFEDGVVILHLDRNKENNSQANIALGTKSDAQMQIPAHMRALYGANAAQKLRVLTDAQVSELRASREAGATLKEISERFGIARSTASYIINRRTYG